MTAPDEAKAFLQVCLAKRLLDKAQAKELWEQARHSGDTPQRILVERGLMAAHTVQALEKELQRAQQPRIVGGFQLIKPLGQGGMATVFLAKQISLGREVALKLMAPHISADPGAVERFLREARVAAAVNHPNVISIIDVGQADGQLYMALELVGGGDAAQLAQRFGGALPEARALELLCDCAKGLQALYEARLVHRDLKPSNIFITGEGTAKLGDLGLARSEDGADRMTVTGHLVGTPAFMSPEQAGGDGDVDIRSDIYALGATLFALVTGRQPFIGNSPIAVAAKALTEAPPDPRALAPHLSAATAALILRTMAKAPGERFQTPRDLREALERALAQAPQSNATVHLRAASGVVNAPTTPVTLVGRRQPTRVVRRARRRPTWPTIAVLVGLTGIIVVAAVALPGRPGGGTVVQDVPPPSPPAATPTPAAKPVEKPAAPVARSDPPAGAVAASPATTGQSTPTPTKAGAAEAAPPIGAEPPATIPWAHARGRDAFGHWAVLRVGGVEQRLRWIPPGRCVIGARPGQPGHLDQEDEATIDFTIPVWMADTECTQALYQAVMGTNPSTTKDPRLPVTDLSIGDGIAFTRALSRSANGARVRLPSRAEWERACRAGTTTTYSTGDDPGSLAGSANLYDRERERHMVFPAIFAFNDGFADLAPVASFKPNRWGLYDMHGNAGEYALGAHGKLESGMRDPMVAEDVGHVGFLKGGNFDSRHATGAACSVLPHIGPQARNPDAGIRFLIEQR